MKKQTIIIFTFIVFFALESFSKVYIIKQTGTSFSPSDITITVGDTVRWEWTGGEHTTTSKVIPDGAAAWDSPLTNNSTTFEYTVTVAGKYNYVCTPHESMGMKGSFTANDATDIYEDSSIGNFTIHPNPSSHFINIAALASNGEIVLSDILGKTLKKASLKELSVVSESYQLDLSDIKAGIYILTFIPADTKKRVSLKVTKK